MKIMYYCASYFVGKMCYHGMCIISRNEDWWKSNGINFLCHKIIALYLCLEINGIEMNNDHSICISNSLIWKRFLSYFRYNIEISFSEVIIINQYIKRIWKDNMSRSLKNNNDRCNHRERYSNVRRNCVIQDTHCFEILSIHKIYFSIIVRLRFC